MDTALEVMKWVVLILLAGFIGQFGKSLSLRVIHYLQERKKGKAPAAAAANQVPPQQVEQPSPVSDPKAEKKMLKGQLKARKKMEKSKSKDALKQT